MANAALFATSCLLLIAHAALLLVVVGASLCSPVPCVLQVAYIAGPLTSMLNHGTTSAAARWLDRSAMLAGACLDVYYTARLSHEGDRACVACLLALAVLAYVSAKCAAPPPARTPGFGEGVRLHALAHAQVLAAHACLLLALDG